MKNALVSIVVPAYNAEAFIEETISSVKGQTHENWELLIVDDGSTDRTLQLARKYAAESSKISCYSKENGGVSSARNLGMERSKGAFVAFLDSDDVWHADFLIACINTLDSMPACGLCYSDYEEITSDSRKTGIFKKGKVGELKNEILLWQEHVISPPSGVLFKREVIEEIGGFDENLSNNADQDFYIRACAKFLVTKTEQPLLKYRVRDDAMHTDIAVLERDSLLVFNKAVKEKRYDTKAFERKCFSNMYLILSVNYWKHNRNFINAIKYLFKALVKNPLIVGSIMKKMVNKI